MQLENAVGSQEAAKELGVTIAMVHRYCREKRLKAKKFGSVWLIERKDLEWFMSNGRRKWTRSDEK